MKKSHTSNNQLQKEEIDWIRAKLEKAEASGFTTDTMEDIIKLSKSLQGK
jgi:antitoxin ParD1/3/4